MKLGIVIIVCSTALAACSKESKEGVKTDVPEAKSAETPKPVATPPAVPVPSAATSAASGDVLEVKLGSVGNTMAFDVTQITAKAGQKVHVVFKNNGNMKLMPHNWVLVKPGTEAAVAAQGMKEAPDAGYVVPGPDVLAFTPLAGPGETTEVTFTAPPAGTYPFVCTVIGHYMMMKGKMTVTP